jgi:hypothetical protein
LRRAQHGAGAAAAFLAGVAHGRRLCCKYAAAASMRLDDNPVIFIIAADDETWRLRV